MNWRETIASDDETSKTLVISQTSFAYLDLVHLMSALFSRLIEESKSSPMWERAPKTPDDLHRFAGFSSPSPPSFDFVSSSFMLDNLILDQLPVSY